MGRLVRIPYDKAWVVGKAGPEAYVDYPDITQRDVLFRTNVVTRDR